MRAATVLRGLRPFSQAIVANHAGDAQPVVAEYAAAATLLRDAVLFQLAPAFNRGFIAEHRQRKYLAGFAEAFEALDGNETVDLFQQRAQAGGEFEVFLFAPGFGPDFENDRDHRRGFRQKAKRRMPPSTGITVPVM